MQFSFAQEKTVTGTVTDGKLPLPDANVVIKGTTKGVMADADGKYAVKAKAGDVLEFSFQGYDKKSVTVGAANSYNVSLKETAKILDEVVVSGAMGIKKSKDALTSTQQVVKAAELTQASNPNVVQSLAGKVSGLVINTVSNGVSPTTKITIRGNRTITGSNDALVVIDNAISSAGVLAQLSPEIIENVNVVKGAQGAALYGAQGVNGVIIVTTKRGSKDSKLKASFSSSVDFENVSYMPTRQDKYGQGWEGDAFDSGNGLGDTSHIPWENGAWGPAFNNPDFAGTLQPTGLPQADGTFIMSPWVSIKDNTKAFFKTGTVLQNGFSLNVGGDDSYAMFTANRQEVDFVVDKDQAKRNSFVFKAGKRLGKFNIDGNISYATSRTSQTGSDLFYELMQTASNIPVERFSAGQNQHHWTVYYDSPYWKKDHVRFDGTSNTMNGILNLGYKINKNIDVSYLANLQLRTSENQSHTDAFKAVDTDYTDAMTNAGYTYNGFNDWTYADLGGHAVTSSFYDSQTNTRNFYGDLVFNFKYDLSDNWNLKFNVGNNIQDFYTKFNEIGGSNLDIDGWYHINNVLNTDPFRNLSNGFTRTRTVGWFGNADLAYKDYLFFNVTGRVEQSSVLFFGGIRGTNLQDVHLEDKGANFFPYPSVGVSFIPTKAFSGLEGNKVLNYAKVYANWVRVGNASAIGAFANDFIGRIPSGFPFGNTGSYVFDSAPTSIGIEPEFVTTKEVGASLQLFGKRVSLDGSYYIQDTDNLITRQTTSSASGASTFLANIGTLQNKGFEIDLGISPFKGDFKWDFRTSVTSYKTKITKLADGANSVNLSSNTFVGVFAEVGEEFPLIKGTIYQRDPEGHVIVNAAGNPLKTSTFQKLGKAAPDYILGFSNSFEYKGVRLTAVADFRTGHKIYSETKQNLAWSGHLVDSAEFDRNDGYVFPNSVQQTGPGVYTENTTPVGNNVGGGYAGVLSYFSGNFDRTGESLVVDATTFRIRELALSYELPKSIFRNTGIASMKVGVNARNPFVWFGNPFKGKSTYENKNYNDPEQTTSTGNAQGLASIDRYPITRTFGFNINLTF
jgi:TonB-linked SusC/RagA family outer membrane protein